MYKNFIGLKEEKRDTIINAALQEFAHKGYDLASTNEIVKKAAISKGALFHYFPSKKELFLFLCDYVFETVNKEFYEQIGHCGGDLLARYHRASRLKANVYRRYPQLFEFQKRLLGERSTEITGELKEKLSSVAAAGYNLLLGGVDESLFRDDVPADKIRDLIIWMAEGYGGRMAEQVRDRDLDEIDMDSINEEFDSYLDVLRKCFYRQ